MNIRFEPLQKSHFPLLFQWLEAPHVKKWWDPEVTYTLKEVIKKYTPYTNGFKEVNGVKRPIQPRVIFLEACPIGYIQIYNFDDFCSRKTLKELPQNLGCLDMFIGDSGYLGLGLGAGLLKQFLATSDNTYDCLVVNPEPQNTAAIRTYTKAGFRKRVSTAHPEPLWMIWERHESSLKGWFEIKSARP